MQHVRGMLRRFRFPWRSDDEIRRDIDDELQFHLTMRAEALERTGLSPEAARREALRQFGDIERLRRHLRQAGRRAEMGNRLRSQLESWWSDGCFALRTLRRKPAFTSTATAVLATGIGATVVMFSLLDAVLLRPLPLSDPQRMVVIGAQPPPDAPFNRQTVRLTVLEEWRSSAASFEGISGFAPGRVTWQGPDGPEMLSGAATLPDFFSVLRPKMVLGRAFTAAEAANAPVVLSYSFWRSRFGERVDAVGQSLALDGIVHTIVGVLPPATGTPALAIGSDVWRPFAAGDVNPNDLFVNVVGRLRHGVSSETAVAELTAIQRAVAEQTGVRGAAGVVLRSMQDARDETTTAALPVLFAASVLFLLIACSNVAALSLAQLVERRPEMAVRASLGATGVRLWRQIVAERVLLWSISGALGLGLGALGLRWLLSTYPLIAGSAAAAETISIDRRVALFACAITLATALVFASLSAASASAMQPMSVMREGHGVSPGRGRRGWREWLAVTQVGLSTVLASVACLLALSLLNLTSQPLGFRTQDLLTFQLELPERDYPDHERRLQFQRALLEGMRAVPGVQAAGTVTTRPLGPIAVGPIGIEGMEAEVESPFSGFQAVDPDYFTAAGIRLVRGLPFNADDTADSEPVAIVNETFATRYFRGQDPVGRYVVIPPFAGSGPLRSRVVGVVNDVQYASLEFDDLPELYLPYEQLPAGPVSRLLGGTMYVALRVPDALTPPEHALRRIVANLDPGLPLTRIATGEQLVSATALDARFLTAVIACVAVFAVVLSAAGLFGVLAQAVAQRRKELGIRVALGATPSALFRMVCGRGIALAAAGATAGVLVTVAFAGYLQSLLFEVSGVEPAVLVAVVLLMLCVATAAAGLPAWRAIRLNPTLAIRSD